MIFRINYLFIYISILFGLSNCGGGSTGGSGLGTYTDTTIGDYGTEYNNQLGLGQLKISSLNNYGYTGQGIKVAVVDSGIDSSHNEFSGRTIDGKDFAGTSGGYGTDASGHGTHVASIIGANREEWQVGISYDINISNLSSITHYRGAFELSVIYIAQSSEPKIYNVPCDRY